MNSSNSNKGEQNPTPQTDQYTIPDYEAGVRAGMLMAYKYWLYDLEINRPLDLPTAYIETLKLRLEAMIRKLESSRQDTSKPEDTDQYKELSIIVIDLAHRAGSLAIDDTIYGKKQGKLEAIIAESTQALLQYIEKRKVEAAYKANRDVIHEQEKYLQDMTLKDGKTVIPALDFGMMYACANRLAHPLETTLLNLKGGNHD